MHYTLINNTSVIYNTLIYLFTTKFKAHTLYDYCRRSDDDVFLESWSDYSPEDDYEDSYIETPIDYMEVSKYNILLWILFCHGSRNKI